MSEENPTDPEVDPNAILPAPKKVYGFTPRVQAAVEEVELMRKNRLPLQIKTIAARHGMTKNALEKAVSRFRRGEAKMNATTPEEMEIDKRAAMRRTLLLLDRVERLMCNSLEGLTRRAEEFQMKGKLLAYRDMGLPNVLRDLRSLNALRRETEEGFMAILEKLNREQKIKAAVADSTPDAVQSMSDSQRARQALLERRKEMQKAMVEAQIGEVVGE